MAYSTNPNLPKARAIALRLLIEEGLSTHVVANKCGVHRSTIWRWYRKWQFINQHWQQDNPNRPGRAYSQRNHLSRCSWRIPTASSRPHYHPWTLTEETVRQVLAVRDALQRCAEVVWHHVTTVLGLAVSLSSVRRVLRRHHCFDGARKKRLRPDNPKRPLPTQPGELVQTDTIHHCDPYSGKRLYYYTVIDVCTRMTYITLATKLRQGLSAQAVLAAQQSWRFTISMVQADNGPEYGRYSREHLEAKRYHHTPYKTRTPQRQCPH